MFFQQIVSNPLIHKSNENQLFRNREQNSVQDYKQIAKNIYEIESISGHLKLVN